MEEEMYKIMAKTQADDQSQDDYLNFTATGGCELTMEEEWDRRGREAKKQAVLQSQDDSVRSTIMTRSRAAKIEEERRKKRDDTLLLANRKRKN